MRSTAWVVSPVYKRRRGTKVLLLNSGVIPSPPPLGGGVERYAFYLANGLARLGCEVHFVTGVSDLTRFDPRVVLLRLPFLNVPIQASQFNVLLGQSLGGAFVHLRVREALAGDSYDIVHGNTNSGSAFSLTWSSQEGSKSVFTVHNTTPWSGRNVRSAQQSIRRATFRLLDAPLLRSVDRLVALSASSAEELTRLYAVPPARIVTVPPGVDTDLFRPDLDTSKVLPKYRLEPGYVLAVGRLVDQKGFGDFVRAFQGTRAVGVLVGDGPNYHSLKRLADRLLSPRQLTFLRSVPPGDLPALFSSASAYVFTSLAEGLPAVGVEALASGLPVVAMRAPGVIDLIEPSKNGLLTAAGDAKALGTSLQQLLDDGNLRRAMGSASRSMAIERYSWPSIASRTLEVYSAALAAPR